MLVAYVSFALAPDSTDMARLLSRSWWIDGTIVAMHVDNQTISKPLSRSQSDTCGETSVATVGQITPSGEVWLLPTRCCKVGDMTMIGPRGMYRVHLDGKRRPTLPAALLADAGLSSTRELVARTDGTGRVILEDPLAMLARFQRAVAAHKHNHGMTTSLVDDLIADRAADPSTSD